jgi:hypothetical protein
VRKKHAAAFSLAVCIPFVVTARTRSEHAAVVPSRRHLIDVSAVHGVWRAAVEKLPPIQKVKDLYQIKSIRRTNQRQHSLNISKRLYESV